MLEKQRPVVKPSPFVGQAASSKDGKGQTQKEQAQIVQVPNNFSRFSSFSNTFFSRNSVRENSILWFVLVSERKEWILAK